MQRNVGISGLEVLLYKESELAQCLHSADSATGSPGTSHRCDPAGPEVG